MRLADAYMAFVAMLCGLLLLALIHAGARADAEGPYREERVRIVEGLGITDLCLFTEARYTRHPAMADLATAFQDHPMALEHFPSGALLMPPAHLKGPR